MSERRNGNGMEARFHQVMVVFGELSSRPENRGVKPAIIIKDTVEAFLRESKLVMTPETVTHLAKSASQMDFSAFTPALMDALTKYIQNLNTKK
ncbi:MAG: hypothetical protein WCT40_02625 [Candidatus Magasanikbacteria bacterium]|jgi:hypothetical protein